MLLPNIIVEVFSRLAKAKEKEDARLGPQEFPPGTPRDTPVVEHTHNTLRAWYTHRHTNLTVHQFGQCGCALVK